MEPVRFALSAEAARFCGEHGLLRADGAYSASELDCLGLVQTLLEAGFSEGETGRYLYLLRTGEPGLTERRRMLLCRRRGLLDSIHSRQRTLDRLDHLLHETERPLGK